MREATWDLATSHTRGSIWNNPVWTLLLLGGMNPRPLKLGLQYQTCRTIETDETIRRYPGHVSKTDSALTNPT